MQLISMFTFVDTDLTWKQRKLAFDFHITFSWARASTDKASGELRHWFIWERLLISYVLAISYSEWTKSFLVQAYLLRRFLTMLNVNSKGFKFGAQEGMYLKIYIVFVSWGSPSWDRLIFAWCTGALSSVRVRQSNSLASILLNSSPFIEPARCFTQSSSHMARWDGAMNQHYWDPVCGSKWCWIWAVQYTDLEAFPVALHVT